MGRVHFGLDVRVKDDSQGAVRVLFDRDRARDQVTEPAGEQRRGVGGGVGGGGVGGGGWGGGKEGLMTLTVAEGIKGGESSAGRI